MRISDWSSDVCSSDLSFRITLEHVLPNILSAIVVQATIQFALAILAEAALSYLGLGTQPPTPSWGRMLNEAQSYVFPAPLLAVWPGCALAIAVLGLNLLGEARKGDGLGKSGSVRVDSGCRRRLKT